MRETLRKTRVLIGPGDRARWVLVIGLGIVAAGFEATGALVILGLLTWMTTGGVDVPLVGDLAALWPDGGDDRLVALALGVVAAFFLLRAATILAHAYVQHRVVENVGARLAARLLAGYLAMPYTFHLGRNSAELIRNAYDTVQQFVRDALMSVVQLVGNALMAVGLVAVLIYTSPWATLVAFVALAPMTWVLLRVIQPRVDALGRTSQRLSKASLQTLDESLAGWRDIKLLAREGFFVEQFRGNRLALARTRYARATLKELPRVVLETGVVLFVVAFVGVSELARGSALEALPVVGLFAYATLRLQPSINALIMAANSLRFVGPGIDLLHHDLMLFPPPGGDRDGRPPLRLGRELRLDGVSVRYPTAHRPALRDVTVAIRAGEFVGVVGPSGGGKSTLVDLVLGLLEPETGTVTVDGLDLREHVDRWHASLGVVPQLVFVADTTLRRNIAFGLPEDEIDEALLADAVRLAQLERFVASLPEGLDTVVGERGVRVSGGERQRLAIARALYRRPSVIVFDEGTSALDNNTEAELMSALTALRGERTIIVVAHRLSTVAACDRVLLVDEGRLVDAAPFDELASRHSSLLALPR